MMEWLKLDNSQKKLVIEQTAIKQGVRAKAIEKDWWVTLTLNALFTSKHQEYIIFKGGTSLSKGWKLIHRFSEDIDLALTPEALGMSYEESPGKGYIDRLRKAGCKFTTEILRAELERQFEILGVPKGMLKIEADEVRTSDQDPQKLFIHYPPLIEPEEYIRDIVMVEVSVKSLKEPSTKISVQSLISETFPEVSNEKPFEVRVVEPHRTFLEKMFLLHESFKSSNTKVNKSERMSRHLYDLVQMMDKEPGKKAIEDNELYKTIIKHRSYYNKIKDVDYETHSPNQVSFIPPSDLIDQYHDDYGKMRESMIYGEPPEYLELISSLGELLRRFRLLANKEEIKKHYEPIVGNYIRWWENDKQKGNARVFARASIKHVSDIKYSINVSTLINYSNTEQYGIDYKQSEIETWTGEIIMESPTGGTIIWNQTNPSTGAKGYKKIQIENNASLIRLIGQKSKGYGDEVFSEKE